jgi:hypothetical protein
MENDTAHQEPVKEKADEPLPLTTGSASSPIRAGMPNGLQIRHAITALLNGPAPLDDVVGYCIKLRNATWEAAWVECRNHGQNETSAGTASK